MTTKRRNWILRKGLQMFRDNPLVKQAAPRLAATFDRESLAKHSKRIKADIDFDQPDAFTNQVYDSMMAALYGPGAPNYPAIGKRGEKAALRMLGIDPEKPPRFAYYGALFTAFTTLTRKVIASARISRMTGAMKSTLLWAEVNYIQSRNVAKQYGNDRGRQTKYLKDISKGPAVMDLADSKAEAFVDDIQRQMLLQQVYGTVTDQRDKAMFEIYYRAFENGTTIEKEHTRKLQKYQALGLRTPASVRQRKNRILQKYPQLRDLNPYR